MVKIVPGENQRQAFAPSSPPPQRPSIPQASNATTTPPPAKDNSLLDSDRSAWKYPRFIQEAYRLGLRVLPMNAQREEMVLGALADLVDHKDNAACFGRPNSLAREMIVGQMYKDLEDGIPFSQPGWFDTGKAFDRQIEARNGRFRFVAQMRPTW